MWPSKLGLMADKWLLRFGWLRGSFRIGSSIGAELLPGPVEGILRYRLPVAVEQPMQLLVLVELQPVDLHKDERHSGQLGGSFLVEDCFEGSNRPVPVARSVQNRRLVVVERRRHLGSQLAEAGPTVLRTNERHFGQPRGSFLVEDCSGGSFQLVLAVRSGQIHRLEAVGHRTCQP